MYGCRARGDYCSAARREAVGSKRGYLSLSELLNLCVREGYWIRIWRQSYGNSLDGLVGMWENCSRMAYPSQWTIADDHRSRSLCIDEEIKRRNRNVPVRASRSFRSRHILDCWENKRRLIRNRFSLYNVIFHASRVRDKAVVYYKTDTLCHLSHVDFVKLLKNENRCLVNISRRMSPFGACLGSFKISARIRFLPNYRLRTCHESFYSSRPWTCVEPWTIQLIPFHCGLTDLRSRCHVLPNTNRPHRDVIYSSANGGKRKRKTYTTYRRQGRADTTKNLPFARAEKVLRI